MTAPILGDPSRSTADPHAPHSDLKREEPVNPGDSLRPPPPQNNPVNNNPVNNNPVNNNPVNNNPVNNNPVNNNPVNNNPVNNNPVNNNPVNNNPVNNNPVNNNPVYRPPVYRPPVNTPDTQQPCTGTFAQNCRNAVEDGYLTEEESLDLSATPPDRERVLEMADQYDDAVNSEFNAQDYQNALNRPGVASPPDRDQTMMALCAGLTGCTADNIDDVRQYLLDEGITDLTPEQNAEQGDRIATLGHHVAFLDRIDELYGCQGYCPPPEDEIVVNNGNNGPTCGGGYRVIAAHIDSSTRDNGCRPPSCPFGRDSNGWCIEPTYTDPPVIYVRGPGDVDEDAGTARFRVVLSHPVTRSVSVTVATSDGTARADSDYTARTRRMTFPVGHTVAWVSVSVTDDDTRGEPDETFTLTASNPSSNAELSANPQADATIIDNDLPLPSAVRNLTMNCSTVGVDGEITVTWMVPDEGTLTAITAGITGPDSYSKTKYNVPAGATEHTFDEAPGWGDYTATVYAYLLEGDGPSITVTQTCQPTPPDDTADCHTWQQFDPDTNTCVNRPFLS